MTHERQSKYEICLTGWNFEKESRCLVRHMLRYRVAISTNGWGRQISNKVSKLLGLIEPMNISTPHATDDDDQHKTMYNSEVDGVEMNIDTSPVVDKDVDLHGLSSNGCKPLSTSMFREVTLQVLSYYKGSPERVKIAARAMMIKMWNLIATKNQRGGDVDVTGGVKKAICEIIELHNSAFANSVNQFTPSGTISQLTVTVPYQQASRMRLNTD